MKLNFLCWVQWFVLLLWHTLTSKKGISEFDKEGLELLIITGGYCILQQCSTNFQHSELYQSSLSRPWHCWLGSMFELWMMREGSRYFMGCRVHHSADLSAVYFILWDIFPHKIMMRSEHLRLKHASFNWTLSHYTVHWNRSRNRNGISRSSNRMSLSIWWKQLLRICEVNGSNLGPETNYHDWGFSCVTLAPQCSFRNSISD